NNDPTRYIDPKGTQDVKDYLEVLFPGLHDSLHYDQPDFHHGPAPTPHPQPSPRPSRLDRLEIGIGRLLNDIQDAYNEGKRNFRRWLVDVFGPSPSAPSLNKSESRSVNSADPNALYGPAGYGPTGFVAPDALFPYRLTFENDPAATAPAQRVDVTNPL